MAGKKQAQRNANVGDAIEGTPTSADEMEARSLLLRALQQKIASSGMSQVATAKLLNLTQLQADALMAGKIDRLPVERLTGMLDSLTLAVAAERVLALSRTVKSSRGMATWTRDDLYRR